MASAKPLTGRAQSDPMSDLLKLSVPVLAPLVHEPDLTLSSNEVELTLGLVDPETETAPVETAPVEPKKTELTAEQQASLDTLFRNSYNSLLRYVASRVGCREEAEEIVMEAFHRIARNMHAIQHHGASKSYLTTTVRNLMVDRKRANDRRGFIPASQLPTDPARDSNFGNDVCSDIAGDDDTCEAATSSLVRQIVREAISTLPRHHQQVIVGHHLLDLEVSEIARRVGVSEGTVKSRLHRGRASLKRKLGKLYRNE